MKIPKKNEIIWLVNKHEKKITLGFLRDQRGGCLIINGPTGSHYSGHAESWKEKYNYYLREGFIEVEYAKRKKILSHDWKPQRIKPKDMELIKMILENRI